MDKTFTRRRFVGVLGGVVVVAALRPAGAAPASAEGGDGLCVTLCNHWSYIGIGWQLGIESCVLSAVDAMGMADREPHVKTCINLDARAYEFMAEKFPEVAERLARYLADGKVELIGGTYGQPLGTMVSGESNIRQIVVGRETIRKALGYEMVTFLEEEEFTHPQIPQIVAAAGFRYASLAQVDTWGRAGIPPLEFNAILWKGIDGTTIPCVPKNSLFGYSPDLDQLAGSEGFKKLKALGKPLIFTWEEFGWESPETPSYLTAPAKYKRFADRAPVEFVTLKEYLDKYGAHPKETVYLPMDAWNKSLTWGLGGDQVRILDRKVEAILHAAERFDAIASAAAAPARAAALGGAWKDLLAAQSHDVGLCEYSRWQGNRMAPFDRIEDYHNFTWGTIGYNHLDTARKAGEASLDASLRSIAGRIGSGAGKRGDLAITVFNPSAWERTDIAFTGRIHSVPGAAEDLVVKDRQGRAVPSQVMGSGVAFLAEKVPAVGYDTYYLDPTERGSAPRMEVDLRINAPDLAMENEHIAVRLDPATGAIRSLVEKRTGLEMLDGARAAFPLLRGKPNVKYPLHTGIPPAYDSSASKAEIDWLERGPLRAVVRARHAWPHLVFETRVSLCGRSPHLEVVSRILANVPPAPDVRPADIQEGYWFSLAPSFRSVSVLRDFPLAIEPTENPWFHALTFVDLVGEDRALLVLHPGTQYFRWESEGLLSNLAMREWESYFSREYGWPRYAEYRHALRPHARDFTHADRVRASSAFTQPFLCLVDRPHAGDLPPSKGFLSVSPAGVCLTAFRKKEGPGYELRVVECEGREADASVDLAIPVSDAMETDLLGRRVGDVARTAGRIEFKVQPWKIRTFEIR